jgi:hypothetical protein
LKAEKINYEIEAIQLNKIDEESVENSSSMTSKSSESEMEEEKLQTP